MDVATRSSSGSRRAASTTLAPSAASMAAIAAPMPIEAPVTTATLSANPVIVSPFRSWPLTGADVPGRHHAALDIAPIPHHVLDRRGSSAPRPCEPDAKRGGNEGPGPDSDPEHEPGERLHEIQVAGRAEGEGGDAVHAKWEDDAPQGGLVTEGPLAPDMPP